MSISKKEEDLLLHICQKHNVNPNYLRTLLTIKREYSYKSASQKNAGKNEIVKHIEKWAEQ